MTHSKSLLPCECLGETLHYRDLPAKRRVQGRERTCPLTLGGKRRKGGENRRSGEGRARKKRGREGGRGFHTAEQARPLKPWTPTPKPKCGPVALTHLCPLCSNAMGTWAITALEQITYNP